MRIRQEMPPSLNHNAVFGFCRRVEICFISDDRRHVLFNSIYVKVDVPLEWAIKTTFVKNDYPIQFAVK